MDSETIEDFNINSSTMIIPQAINVKVEDFNGIPSTTKLLPDERDVDMPADAAEMAVCDPDTGIRDDKICGVCGDKALGCNFDALSCESCKAFFRRNALKNKLGKCIFQGSCRIDVNTRRFCPFCRLKKCFDIGMRKDLILGEEEKKQRMEKVLRNRRNNVSLTSKPRCRRRSGSSNSSNTTLGEGCSTQLPISSTSQPSLIHDAVFILTSPTSSSMKHNNVDDANSSAVFVAGSIHDALRSQSLTRLILQPNHTVSAGTASTTTVMSAAGGTVFTVPQSLAAAESLGFYLNGVGDATKGSQTAPDLLNICGIMKELYQSDKESVFSEAAATRDMSAVSDYRQLNADEEKLVQELVQVYDLSFTVDLEPLVHIKQLDPSLNQLVNQSSITVLRLIKFAKRLDEFARLPQLCQIGILKGCWIHILILRSVSVYDVERDVWVTPRGDIPTEILKNATGYVRLHDDHVRYCKSIKSIIGDDLAILVIVVALVLFSAEGPHVAMREVVSNIQDKYIMLLKHYLEARYSYSKAADMFPQLMSKVKELKDFAEIHGRCLVDINPSEIEPIMLEILDLK